MPSEQHITPAESQPRKRRLNLELYYYERIGSCYYLRITPFALVIIFLSMIIGLTILYLGRDQQGGTEIRNTPPPILLPSGPLIREVPPLPTPRSMRQPTTRPRPSPPPLPSPVDNSNEL